MASIHVSPTAQLYGRHRVKLIKLSSSIVGCSALAEDIVQEAFLHFATKTGNHHIRSPIAYLTTMVRNLSVDMIRKQVRERKAFKGGQLQAPADIALHYQLDPEMIALWRSEYRTFKRALDSLPRFTRDALQMYLYEGQNYRMIAERLDISVGKAHALVKDGIARCDQVLRLGET